MNKIFLIFAYLFCWCSVSVFADLPFRNHRYDAFKVLKVTSENIVFVGNSITNMHEWWEAFNNHNIINRGVSGAVSDETVNNLESVIEGKPKKIFLMIGTNDLGTDGINTTAHVAGNTRIIIDRILQESPATEIYVQSILPSRLRNMELQKATNDSIKKICIEKSVTYINLWDKLLSITQNNEHTLDGLHLTATGYRIWCKAIEEYVGSTCVYPDDARDQTAGLSGSLGMRASYFGMLPVKDGDVLMIGDEMFHGGEWHELLHCNRVKNRGTGWGYPGADINTVVAEVPVILKGRNDNGQPAKIFLYVGAADANGSTALSILKNNYGALITKIRNNAPQTQIYIQALLPTPDAAKNTSRVIPFNDMLKEIAETSDNVDFVDTYTPFVKAGIANADYFNGSYLYGKGYAKLSQIIAPLVGDDASAISDDEATEQIEKINARNSLGAAIKTATAICVGNGVGEYTSENAKALLDEIVIGYDLLAKEAIDNSELLAEASKINSSISSLLPKINMPKVSEVGAENWYNLYTPLRGSRYMTSKGVGKGVTGDAVHNYATGQWKFVERGDGAWNIVNRADNSYLNPAANYNAQIFTSLTEPVNGWELSYANTPGMFIVKSGSVELNQTNANLGYKIYNWSNGNTGQDRTDPGCQFTIVDAGEPDEVLSLPEPLLNMEHIKLNGSKPRQIADELAAPVLENKGSTTIVIDFTSAASGSDKQVLIASSNPTVSNRFFSASVWSNNYSVVYRTEGADGVDQLFTNAIGNATDRHKIIYVIDNDKQIMTYYLDGVLKSTYDYKAHVAWRMASLGNLPDVKSLYLGGLVTSDNVNKWPFTGEIHSVRVYPGALNELQMELIKYVDPVDIPAPVLTLTDIDLDGSQPYRLSDSYANAILDAASGTVAVDFTPSASSSNACVLIGGSSETDAAQYFGIVTREVSKYGVQYIGDNNKEGWYTQAGKDFSKRNKMVITMDGDNKSYAYFMNGAADRTVSGMGEYGYRIFGNVPNISGVFLGGIVTSNNVNKYPFAGSIHSIRFWNKVLTAEQIAALEYDDLKPTGILPVVSEDVKADTHIYDLQGRPVSKVGKGIYIVSGEKIIIK